MVVAGLAIFAFGIAMIWYLLARGSHAATISEEDFDHAYDELVAKGEIVDDDREAAWRDFHAGQVMNEKERLSWDEAADE
jgi:hypothetical protein